MIGYLILLGFWILATLTLFALPVPSMLKKGTKIVISLSAALIAVGVFTGYIESYERTWWAWLLLVLAFIGSVSLSVYVEERELGHEQEEVPQRMVK